MVINVQLHCMTRLRGLTTAYGHTMPIDLKCTIGDGGMLFAPVTFVAQGISVPISWGSPPISSE